MKKYKMLVRQTVYYSQIETFEAESEEEARMLAQQHIEVMEDLASVEHDKANCDTETTFELDSIETQEEFEVEVIQHLSYSTTRTIKAFSREEAEDIATKWSAEHDLEELGSFHERHHEVKTHGLSRNYSLLVLNGGIHPEMPLEGATPYEVLEKAQKLYESDSFDDVSFIVEHIPNQDVRIFAFDEDGEGQLKLPPIFHNTPA